MSGTGQRASSGKWALKVGRPGPESCPSGEPSAGHAQPIRIATLIRESAVELVGNQHAQARSAPTELLSNVEHVLGRTPEAVQGSDDERVTSLECVERAIELPS